MTAGGNEDERTALISGNAVDNGLVYSGTYPGSSTKNDDVTDGHADKLVVTLCILITEFCERLTFYGLVANMVLFCKDELDLPAPWPSTINLIFSGACYFIPLMGGWLADARLGRYNVIYGSMLIYAIGALLILPVSYNGIDHNKTMRLVYFVLSLVLVALGTGGIKANVAPLGADQLARHGPRAVEIFFIWFYWFINLGGLISFTVVVYIQQKYGFFYGYLIPAGTLLLTITVFVSGRNKYVIKPPGGSQLIETVKIIYQAVKNRQGQSGEMWLDRAKSRFGGAYTDAQVEDVKTLLRIIPMSLLFVMFFVIFPAQLQTTWLIQATYMKLEFQSFTVPPASIFSFDIIWVLVITPIVGQVVYPLLKSCGISFTSLRRIGVGMLFAAASMIVAGLVEIIRRREVEEGNFFDQVVFGKHRQASNLNVFWQIPQFLIMGCAEVLAVTTGLEFSYSQSPEHMKGVVLGIFCISTGIGYWLSSLLEVIVRSASNNKWYPSENPNEGTMECYFFLLAGLMIVNFVIFVYVASRYKYRTAPKESEKTANDREEDQLDEPEV